MKPVLDIPFNNILEYWDDVDKRGASLEGVRALCLEDRYYLLVKVMGRVDMLHPWVFDRCREVQRAPDGYLDLWAREHFKSSIITQGGSVQEILRNPEITIGIFSHTSPIASGFLRVIKQVLESNQILLRVFPDVLYDNPDKDARNWSLQTGITVIRKGTPNESTVEAYGLVDGQPVSKHFELLIFDDVVTDKSVYTPEQIEKTTASWELADNLSKVGGRKWHVGTRYSYADTYEAIIKRGAVKVRRYTATKNNLMDGEPVLFPPELWEQKKIVQGEATIACQMMQDPLSGTQRMFNIEDFQTYEIRPETLNVFLMCDPARSNKKDSADSAYVVVGLDYAMNKYLLDGYAHKMDLQERWQRLRELFIKWKRAPGVQSVRVGYESFGAQSDLDYYKERMKIPNENGQTVSFGITELAWPREGGGSKTDRVQRLTPDMRQHKIFLPHPTDPEKLTRNQRAMHERGYDYRISRIIKRKDGDGNAYDLSEKLKLQTHYFPFGGLKDLIDIFSRIYDMEATPPQFIDERSLEPEFT